MGAVWSVPTSWATPSSTSLLGRFLARQARHPDEFDCAVRVVAGELPGEAGRWRYRRSAVDPLMPASDVVTLTHGRVVLRLRFTGDTRPRSGSVRSHHRIWPATELTTGALVEVAADAGEEVRFRLLA